MWVGIAVVIAAAIQTYFTYRVSNLLTLSAIVAGWITAHVLSDPRTGPLVGGNLASSLGCTFLVLGMFLPVYSLNVIPAGSIKAQMALSAWIGCALPLGSASMITLFAEVGGAIATAVGFGIYYQKYRAIIVSARAATNVDPRGIQLWPPLFPCQITLSLGSMGGIVAAAFLGFV